MMLAAAAMNVNAQLTVDSLGKVIIDPLNNPPTSPMPMGGYSATIRPLGAGGILIKRPSTDNHGSLYGINIDIDGIGPRTAGILSNAEDGTIYTCGVKGTASSTSTSPCYGIFGGLA